MNGCQAIKAALETTKSYLHWYLGDFTDADMLVRPVPGANHAAWQVGNIIGGDIFFVHSEFPDAPFPALPAGFADLHGTPGASQEGPQGFLTKDAYLKLFDDVRAATIAALDKLTDADLDRKTTGAAKDFAPTLAHLFLMASDHTIMHVGQFTVIRRKLNKPVLF
ncbi:MAG TPA: DinB family protein [Gemmataceae bacterium]|nr:DinB family protein [Gemmataceae bacterium]